MTSATGRPARWRAFTLLEVLVAVTILGLVSTALVAAFHAGLQAYRIGEQHGTLSAHVRGTTHLLECDLAAMVPLALPRSYCGADGLTFVVRGQQATDPPRWVSYRWEAERLFRHEEPFVAHGSGGVQTVALLGEVSRVQFQYLAKGQWLSEHPAAAAGMPEAVRIRGTVGPAADNLPFETVFRCTRAASRKGERDEPQPSQTQRRESGDAVPPGSR